MTSNHASADELADFAHQREPFDVHWMDERITRFLERNAVIPRTDTCDGEIVEHEDGRVSAGSGPEYAATDIHVNPNWLRNRAINFLNIADYLENRDARLAAAEAAATERRDLTTEAWSGVFGGQKYDELTPVQQKLVDRVVELESR